MRLIAYLLFGTSLTALPATAFAHVLAASEAHVLPGGWSFEYWVVIVLMLSLVLYVMGWLKLRTRSRHGSIVQIHRVAAFMAGWLALGLSLCSPLDTWSDALFSVHMLQHETMMIVAAPLLVIGRPLPFWLWAFPHAGRIWFAELFRGPLWRRFWRWLTAPAIAWCIHVIVLWGWHMPKYFEAALSNEGIHALQHISFLLSAVLLWWTILGEAAHGHRGQAMLSLFTTMVHTGALGALLTLAPGVWYPSYIEPCSALGIDPLHDQQLGGLVMWIPTGVVYVVGALFIVGRWLTRPSLGMAVGHRSETERGDGG